MTADHFVQRNALYFGASVFLQFFILSTAGPAVSLSRDGDKQLRLSKQKGNKYSFTSQHVTVKAWDSFHTYIKL